MSSTTLLLKQAAHEQGFHAVGIARVPSSRPDRDASSTNRSYTNLYDRLANWLAQGYHGTMEWMERTPKRRADPTQVLPNCRSIISLGINYWTDVSPDERRGNGRIARYAWGEDYHRVFKNKLKQFERVLKSLEPACHTRSYVDTGPVMEKFWAQQAGLGWIGKHSNLVSPTFGSWLLLGEILTTAELEADAPGTDLCGTCTLCIQACPTGAIVEPYVVDATRCISYLTIEYRGDGGSLDRDVQTRMGNRIFGCDDCLEVCPYNAFAPVTDEPAVHPTGLTQGPSLSRLSALSEEEFSRTFSHSPIRRAKFSGFRRNVAIALTNEPRPRTSSQATSTPPSSRHRRLLPGSPVETPPRTPTVQEIAESQP